ncbi:hypothetical protein [Nocardioides antri]|uniref:Uncharacterized protein n=1 Tax=Nocardioides antri TaxID=2607659 RepID=A0A5B1M6G0_9ACTN|nr:hypothetical protein [Nocardioides antri]KAA1428443.1 hypothetical protein F0U47_05865 [Nocardioides antri]
MSDIEQRLRSALTARAELVQPEDLSLSPVFDPPEVDPGPWWQRPGAYLFIAAVAIIVIALPLLALASTIDDDGDPDRDQIAPSPTGTVTMTDPMPAVFGEAAADVDGDGTDDKVQVVSTDVPEDPSDEWAIEVELSSTGETLTFDPGPVQRSVALVETADVDGRNGQEVLAVVDPRPEDVRRTAPIALGLRDGELTQIVDHEFATGDDGRLTHWWVRDGELWWWRTQEPVAGGQASSPYAVDALRFPPAARLRGERAGVFCVAAAEPNRLLPCGGGIQPNEPDGDGDGDDGGPTGGPVADPWWTLPADGLPSAWGVEGGFAGGFVSDIDGDGQAQDSVSIADGPDGAELVVGTGSQQHRAPIDGPNPKLEGVVHLNGLATPVVLVHSTEGATSTTYVSWAAYAFVDGDLARISTTPLGPSFASQYSKLTPAEGGHPVVRTWLVGDNGLYGMDYLDRRQVEGPGGEVWAYRVRVRSWYVDGRTIRAVTLGQGCVAPAVGRQISDCPDGL